jgi:diacylglycerol kinase family enzyme
MMRNVEPMHDVSQQEFETRDEEFRHALREMKKVAQRTPPHEYGIEIDGADRSGAYVLVEAMNIACIGPNLCLAPQADASDGLLDLVLLPAEQRERFCEYLARRMEGDQNLPELLTVRGKEILIDPKGAPLHIDDELHSESHEPLEPPGAIEVTVKSGQTTFLL